MNLQMNKSHAPNLVKEPKALKKHQIKKAPSKGSFLKTDFFAKN